MSRQQFRDLLSDAHVIASPASTSTSTDGERLTAADVDILFFKVMASSTLPPPSPSVQDVMRGQQGGRGGRGVAKKRMDYHHFYEALAQVSY